MSDGPLLQKLRDVTHALLAGYLSPLRTAVETDRLIQSPALAGDSALAGAIQMAQDFLTGKERTT